MNEQQERLLQIASAFGDSDIKIFVGRDKVYPDKTVSEDKVQQLEQALKSPETEMSAINVKQGNDTVYRSIEGAVTTDTKGVAAQFQAPKTDYFDLLQGFADKVPGYFENKFTPDYVNQQLSSSDHLSKPFGESIDRWVMTEAIDRGMPKDAVMELVTEQSPYVAKLTQEQAAFPKAHENYLAPSEGLISREFDYVLDKYTQATQAPEVTQSESQQQAKPVEVGVTTETVKPVAVTVTASEVKPVELATSESLPLKEFDLSTAMNGRVQPQTQDEQLRAATEPQLAAQIKAPAPSAESSRALVPVPQSKALIPIEPTPQQLNQKMPAMVTPSSKPAESLSLEQALATAQSRIDSMQKQLDSTTASVTNLSAQLQDITLKGWTKNTAQKLQTTVQTFASQAKTDMGQWVSKGVEQIQQKAQRFKDAAQTTVGNVKSAAVKAVGDVKFAAQVKTIEVKEAVLTKVNTVLAPVDTVALTKAADHMINRWGQAGRFEGNTFDFQRSGSGDISIHTKDGTAVFAKGTVTDQADAKIKAHLNELPRRVGLAQSQGQNQSQTLTPQKSKQPAIVR